MIYTEPKFLTKNRVNIEAIARRIGNEMTQRDESRLDPSQIETLMSGLDEMVQPSFAYVPANAMDAFLASRHGRGDDDVQKSLLAFFEKMFSDSDFQNFRAADSMLFEFTFVPVGSLDTTSLAVATARSIQGETFRPHVRLCPRIAQAWECSHELDQTIEILLGTKCVLSYIAGIEELLTKVDISQRSHEPTPAIKEKLNTYLTVTPVMIEFLQSLVIQSLGIIAAISTDGERTLRWIFSDDCGLLCGTEVQRLETLREWQQNVLDEASGKRVLQS